MLNLLNFSSLDKPVSRRKYKDRNEVFLFNHNLFISLTYMLTCFSIVVKQEEESGSAAKKLKLDPIREPGTSEVSSTGETRKFKGRVKRKISFSVD